MYEARISRNHPAAFLILIDQSGSMSEPTTFHGRRMSKSEAVALTVNMLIDELLNRCKREEGYRDYFDIAVQGYHGDRVVSLWGDPERTFMRPSEREPSSAAWTFSRNVCCPEARPSFRS